MGHPPVVIAETNAPPRVQVADGVNAPTRTVVDDGAPAIMLVESGAPPIALLNPDGSRWSAVPEWVPSGASFYADFANGRYWDGSVTDFATATDFTRASAGLADDTDGMWSSFATDVARITDKGIRIEPTRQNKCENHNANPTDTTNINTTNIGDGVLTVVDDSAALAAAGLGNICSSGNAYRLDNSAGAAVSTLRVIGDTNSTDPHTVSCFARGSGAGLMGLWNGGQSVAVAYTEDYTRFVGAGLIPSAVAGNGFFIRAGIGETIYFVLNQLEAGSTATAPIVVAGTAVTRAVDALTLHLPTGTHDLTFTFDDDSTQEITGQSGDYAVPTTLNRRTIKTVAGFPG